MTTTTEVSTTTIPLVPPRLPEPPPATLELSDGDTVVGWVAGDAIGFRGFANVAEAASAAWVAYRTVERRRAQAAGGRPVPVDIEPLALDAAREPARILAGGRPIATLVRPGDGSPGGAGAFGFELRVPPPADDLRVRSTAYLVYRTLRRSGLRWALFARPRARADGRAGAGAGERPTDVATSGGGEAARRPVDAARWPGRAAAGLAGAALLALGLLAAAWLQAVTASVAVGLLGAVAAVLALAAVGALVRVVVADLGATRVRRRFRPGGGTPGATAGRAGAADGRRAPSVARAAAGSAP